MIGSGGFLVWIAAVLLGGIVTAIVMLMRLLYRIGDRGARRAYAAAMSHSARSLFGPAGPPEELCRRLLQKYPSLSPGVHGGLAFSASGCKGRLDFISDMTEIRFDVQERVPQALEVSTPSFITQVAEDDPNAFRVRGSDSLYQKVFADPDLGRMLREWGVPFEWKIGPPGFVLQIRSLPEDEEELWQWLKGAFRLLYAVPGLAEEEPPRVPGAARTSPGDGVCQICGATLGQGTVVHCRRCATPHHEDCWTYTGECSTFACKERAFRR